MTIRQRLRRRRVLDAVCMPAKAGADRADFEAMDEYAGFIVGMIEVCPDIAALWDTVGSLIELFKPAECANYFKAAGYEPD